MRRVVVTLVMLSSTIVFARPAAAAMPSATASPSTGLVDAQVVNVRWHGFKPSAAKGGLVIIECLSDVQADAICDRVQSHQYVHIPSPIPRSGSASYTVHSGGLDLNVSCGISPETNNCVILVAALDRRGRLIPGYEVEVPISFDLSQTTPNVTADPTSGLIDGQDVHLVGTHFSATQQDPIYECDGNYVTVGWNACGITNTVVTGNFDVEFPVHQGIIRSDDHGTCGTSTSDNNCVIAVVPDVETGLVFGSAIFIPITFTLPPSDRPRGSVR